MEEEDKVNIEEAFVNLGYVKKELEEKEFVEKQYKITLTYKNIFDESLIDQRNSKDSLIGFSNGDVIMESESNKLIVKEESDLDGDVIMEFESVKLEDVKEENDPIQKTVEQSRCTKCDGNYQGYCLNCSSLSHILNNAIPNLNSKPDLSTIPIDILEVREILRKQVVFALKAIPKGLIVGPFEGIAPIESTTGHQWKIKNKKIINDQNGNWMKYIESVANSSLRNLDVFQLDGMLYFETSREIQEGEQLLVCYCVEDEKKSDKEGESYLVPVKKEEYPKVFACTFCCLGFRFKTCLVEHKGKCLQGVYGGSIEDFEVIQCRCCKVWLEKRELLESHMLHCIQNYNTLYRNLPHFQRKTVDEIQGSGEILTPIDQNKADLLTQTEVMHSKYWEGTGKAHKREDFSEKKHKCSECSYETNHKPNLERHLNTHNDFKPFECDICNKRFTEKASLKKHMRNQHSNTNEKKYKCSECYYQTNDKGNLNRHSNTHKDKEKYKCLECSYLTNSKQHLNRHLNTHKDIKPFKCDVCKRRFKRNDSLSRHLKKHIRYQHPNTNEKEYKCSECSYQTNDRSNLKRHSNTHKDKEKVYKCPECSYQTNRKEHLKQHLNTHKGIKPFECDACNKRFTQKGHLKLHVITQHSNTSEKEYKCVQCSYQTNYKANFRNHLNITHKDIKPFECDVCKTKFKQKDSLNRHTRNKHSKTSEKE